MWRRAVCKLCQSFKLFDLQSLVALKCFLDQVVHAFFILRAVVIAIVIVSIIMDYNATTCSRWNVLSIALIIVVEHHQ